ncbi:polyphosphate kinase 1 [Bartonella sp. DGB1]|uniref:polyphosphate kinase 1 n=1 Tax=Bartonella sp. DGB1 TaxID=3239807 RepID=UPI003526C26C
MQQHLINREFSLLEFNRRVLNESSRKNHPLLERVKFLSLSASNLDEFFMVRLAGMPDKEIITKDIVDIQCRQTKSWDKLKDELSKNGINILSIKQLTKKNLNWLDNFFNLNIFPTLTPIAISINEKLPFIPNSVLSLVALVKHNESDQKKLILLRFPRKLSRLILLGDEHEGYNFILVDDIITYFLPKLLPHYSVLSSCHIRILRDSYLEIDEESINFIDKVKNAVKKRRYGKIVRVEVLQHVDDLFKQTIIKALDIDSEKLSLISSMLKLEDVIQLVDLPREDLKFPPLNSIFPAYLKKYNNDCFKAIQKRDRLIHHPYETFDLVVDFLSHAASDPDVVTIKQTLYRTSADSPIIKALIEAARAGKAVTALVELKARFDEEANLKWAKDLEEAGVQVIFGFLELKIHAKLSLIVRKEGETLRSYVHVGTGNYHPVTARTYTDLSLFTCNPTITYEVSLAFNYITSHIAPQNLQHIALAPINLREKILYFIQKEIKAAKAGKKAAIWMKMNALIDEEIIENLYKASSAGVKIKLIIRGICCLRPNVKGLSENIKVKSIVGRFLEHSRIYCFANGEELPSSKAIIYIGSADLMPRNLNRRVELLVPIEDKKVHKKILEQIMLANLLDNQQSYEILSDGTSRLLEKKNQDECFNTQNYFLNPYKIITNNDI